MDNVIETIKEKVEEIVHPEEKVSVEEPVAEAQPEGEAQPIEDNGTPKQPEDRSAFNCPLCKGEGLISQDKLCPECNGTGKV